MLLAARGQWLAARLRLRVDGVGQRWRLLGDRHPAGPADSFVVLALYVGDSRPPCAIRAPYQILSAEVATLPTL